MSPRVIRIDPDHPDDALLQAAADVLRQGGLVAFPTETVYGLGAHALDPEAVERIYEAKGRPPTNPIIVHVASIAQARQVAAEWSETAQALAERFWPGPLTLVVPKRAEVPDRVTAGLDTVGLRMPDHPVALRLIELAGVPVAAPSANRYTAVSPTDAAHVIDGLGGAVDIIVDAGPTSVGIESTVLSLTGEEPRILRPGMVGAADLAELLGDVGHRGDLSEGSEVHAEAGPASSPGLAPKHYAPRAEVILYDRPGEPGITDHIANPASGWIALHPPEFDHAGPVEVLGDQPTDYARGLYAALHRLDAAGVETVLIEQPPPQERWRAIRDRLQRAATG